MEKGIDGIPQWLRGQTLKRDPYSIPGDPFIEITLTREQNGRQIGAIRVSRSSKENEQGDPFVSHDVETGKPVNLTDQERYQAYIGLSINPPKLLVRSLERHITRKQ